MEGAEDKLSDEEIQKLVDELRDWLVQELPNSRRDDHFILRFLEGCKYKTERAKEKLKNDYNFRKKTKEWFANRDSEGEDIKDVMAAGILLCPEGFRDEKGRRVLFSRPNVHDPSVSADSYFKAAWLCMDEAMEDDPSIARDGVTYVVDLAGTTFTHCVKKMMVVRKMIYLSLECYAMRIKMIHFINVPSYAIYFLNIVKSFLKEKMRKRIVIHKKIEDVKKEIDPKYLPDEYGGTAGSISEIKEKCLKRISGTRQFFIDWEYRE